MSSKFGTRDRLALRLSAREHAVAFIRANKDRPFLLYVPHSMPHVPLHVSKKFRGKSGQGTYGDTIMEIDWSVGEILKALKRHKLEENPARPRYLVTEPGVGYRLKTD